MPPKKLVLATGNQGKLAELQGLLQGQNYELVAQSQFGFEEAIEDGLSFIENAIIKARHAAKHTDLPSLADDSGLEVDALRGAPGIYSARFAGQTASDSDNVAKLLRQLSDVASDQRSARFHCVVAYVRHAEDPAPLIVARTWEGEIAQQCAGENGFGYDPVFYVPSEGCTAAQLSPEEKNTLSHRGQALRGFCEKVQTVI